MLRKLSYVLGVLFLVAFLAGCQSTSTTSQNYGDVDNTVTLSDDASIVYFDFDSSEIRADQNKKIDTQAKFISNSKSSFTIEGHTDETGTVDYNIALGERRASIVKDALVSKGVEASKLKTVTYGKSRLIDTSGGSKARAKNRRAVTVTE